jgi:hypothetical protein
MHSSTLEKTMQLRSGKVVGSLPGEQEATAREVKGEAGGNEENGSFA